MADKTEVGRLAFRVEGEMWNAYWAPSLTSMDDAMHLGSVRMSLATASIKAKEAFMEAMKAAFVAAMKDATGLKTEFDPPRPAPERERAGSA